MITVNPKQYERLEVLVRRYGLPVKTLNEVGKIDPKHDKAIEFYPQRGRVICILADGSSHS